MASTRSRCETLSSLQDALRISLTTTEASRQHFLQVKAAMNEITSRGSVEDEGSKMTETGSVLFLRCIIQPYAVKTFKAKTKICGPLARCLFWFLNGITEEMADTVWSILLRNKQYREHKSSVDAVLGNPKRNLKVDSESAQSSISILVELLTIDDLESEDADAIVGLLRQSITYLRSVPPAETSSSKSTETVDNLREAYFALLSSKPLLSQFFDPVIRKASDSKSDEDSTSDRIANTEDGQEADLVTVLDSEYLVLEALQRITEPSELANAFFEGLRDVYHVKADPVYSRLQKYQLMKIWNTLIRPESVFLLDQFINAFCTTPFPNLALLLDVIELIFTSSTVYSKETSLFDKIYSIMYRLGMHMSFLNPLPQFFQNCFSFASECSTDEVWLLERLWFTSLLCNKSNSSVLSIAPDFCDAMLKHLFVFCLSHRDVFVPTSLDQEARTVISCVKAIVDCLAISSSCPLFSSLLSSLIDNRKELCFLISTFASETVIYKWVEQVSSRDVECFFSLFENANPDSVAVLLPLLNVMLHSPDAKDALVNAAVSPLEWMKEARRWISFLNEDFSLDKNLTVSCVLALCVLIEQSNFDTAVDLLLSFCEQIIETDVPLSDFSSVIKLLLGHQDSETSPLAKFVSSVLQIAAESDHSKHPLPVFDNFLLFLTKASDSDKNKLLSVFHVQMKQILALLVKGLDKDTKAALHKIGCLALNVEVSASDGDYQVRDTKSSKSNASFFSAKVNADQIQQIEAASSQDLQSIVDTLKRPELALKSGALRGALLTKSVSKVEDRPSEELRKTLIMTSTTKENIKKIEEMADDGVPVLLEGSCYS